jgi:hypothetical protein
MFNSLSCCWLLLLLPAFFMSLSAPKSSLLQWQINYMIDEIMSGLPLEAMQLPSIEAAAVSWLKLTNMHSDQWADCFTRREASSFN